MPLSKHFGGKGEQVMARMKKTYKSPKKAEEVFYATENKMEHAKHMKKMKSHGTMTKGAYGDIGVRRQEESTKVGGFKAGTTVKASAKL